MIYVGFKFPTFAGGIRYYHPGFVPMDVSIITHEVKPHNFTIRLPMKRTRALHN